MLFLSVFQDLLFLLFFCFSSESFQEPQEIQPNTAINLLIVNNMFQPKSSSLVFWELSFLQLNTLYITGMNRHKYEKLLLPLFKQAQKFKHFENMTMFSSGMRKKYKKNGSKYIWGWPGKALCGKFEQETHYRMLDASEQKVSDKEARFDCCWDSMHIKLTFQNHQQETLLKLHHTRQVSMHHSSSMHPQPQPI